MTLYTYTQRKNWLGSEEGIVTKTFQIPSTTTSVLENGRKIVKSGTYFATPFKGLLFEDADITDGDALASIMISGYYIDAKLPATVVSHATDFIAQGLYALVEDSVSRPSFGDGLPTQLATPTATADSNNNAVDWSDVSNESGYIVYESGKYVGEVAAGTLTLVVTKSGSYQVQAKGDQLTYRNSALSTAVAVTVS